ncbi:MAG: hypothetical protein ACT4PM_08255 [Gemmatimonadales bacterium]
MSAERRAAESPSRQAEPSRRRADEPSRLTFHLIPHTHWDREWYLPRAAFQARLIPVLDEVLDQLEREPTSRFLLDGQTILLEDYLAVRPEQEDRIRAQVERGALEIGPWYVLADLLIPSATSIRRNLAEGARQANRFGRPLDVVYSPDAFGHPAALPAIAAEFGLRRAVVRRGLGRPGEFYRWEDSAGETLLVYQLPPAGYDVAIGLADAGPNLGRRWPSVRGELVERAATGQIAVFLGADHHAMVPDVAGLRDRLQQLEPTHEVRISGLTEFFQAAERALVGVRLPVVRGELRSSGGRVWVLQDVHSSRSRLKREHAAAELMFARIAEPLARLAREAGGPDLAPLVHHAWRTLLQCQFHDTLAGTTADAAQAEQRVRLSAVRSLAREITDRGLASIAGYDPDAARPSARAGDLERFEAPGPRLVLWNPADRARGGIATALLTFFRRDVPVGPPPTRPIRLGQGYRPFALESPAGEIIPVQVLRVEPGQERRDAARHYPDQDEVDRVWVAFQASEVPGLGVTWLAPRRGRYPLRGAGLRVEPGLLVNSYVSVRVTPDGTLTLTDLRSGAEFPDLVTLIDEPDRGDLYTFSPAGPAERASAVLIAQTVRAEGPLIGALEARWAVVIGGEEWLQARLLVVLHADAPLVRLRLDLDNWKTDHRLRARFPVEPGRAVSGAALGAERREPIDPRTDGFERVVATVPAQRFIAAAGHRKGLAVFAPGFFEAEWTRKGEILVTLLRSVGELSRADLPARPGHAAWPVSTPDAHEFGRHTIELGLAPVDPDSLPDTESMERMWEDLFLPVQARYFREFGPR